MTDFYPVTPEGRIVAIVLITTGVGLFGSFTAVIASWILEPHKEREREEAMQREITMLNSEIQELKALIQGQTDP